MEIAKFHEEIDREVGMLKNVTFGSAEHNHAVESVSDLMEQAIKLEELEAEKRREEKRIEQEERKLTLAEEANQIELKKLKEERRARWLKHGVDILLGLVGTGAMIWAACTSLQFETDDAFTSSVGKKTLDALIKNKP